MKEGDKTRFPVAQWRRTRIAGVVAAALAPLLLSACADRDTQTTRVGHAVSTSPAMSATVNDIAENLSTYQGKTVTVSGEINDVLGPRAFTIGGEEFYGGRELLVVSTTPIPAIPDRPENEYLVDNDIVHVTGTVRSFTRVEVEREASTPLEGEVYAEWESKPVLVTQAVTVTPRIATTAAAEPLRDVLVIVTTPDLPSLAGRRVKLTGVKVQSVVGDRAFWIGPSADKRLFVVLDRKLEEPPNAPPVEGEVNVDAGQTIAVSGVLRRSPTAETARSRWNLTSAEAAPLAREAIYLHADQVEIARR